MKYIKHYYDYNHFLIDESKRDDIEKNFAIYNSINKLGESLDYIFEIHHFISKLSQGPDDLYEDFLVSNCPEPIRHKLVDLCHDRFLTPVEVSRDKGFLDIKKIKEDLYASRS
jgi:hypothetical protein